MFTALGILEWGCAALMQRTDQVATAAASQPVGLRRCGRCFVCFYLFLHGLTSGLWSVTEPSPDAPGPRGQGMSICYNRALAAELVSSSLNLAASRRNTAGRYLSIGLHATLTATPIVADFCCGCLLQACSPQPATLPVGLPPAAGSARQHTGLRTNASATPSDAQPASAAAPVMHNRFQNQS